MTLTRQPQPLAWDLDHWRGLQQGQFLVQRCGTCGRSRWFPSVRCPHCASPDHAWEAAPTTGTIFTWTTTYRSFHPEFVDVPFTVLVVELDGGDDLHVVAALSDSSPDDGLAIGKQVELRIETDTSTGQPLARAHLLDTEPTGKSAK